MTKISSTSAYPKKIPVVDDYFVGTDSEDFGKTVNFGFENVAHLVNELNGTPIIDYVFNTSPYIDTEVLVEGRFLSLGSELNTSELTKLYVNKFNNSGDNLSELYLFLQTNVLDFYVKIRNSNNQNNAVYYDISSIQDFPDYFIFNISSFKENEFFPLLENFNLYFFEFELKSATPTLTVDNESYFTVPPNFSLLGNILTLTPVCRWKINGQNSAHYSGDINLTINYSSTGMLRVVFVYVTTNTNQYYLISGDESVSSPIAPTLPDNSLLVTFMIVSDNSISAPPPPVVLTNYITKSEQKEYIITEDLSPGNNLTFLSTLGTTYRIQNHQGVLKSTYSPSTAPFPGQEITIVNEGSYPLSVKHLEKDFSFFDSFFFPTEEAYSLQQREAGKFRYINEVWHYLGTITSLINPKIYQEGDLQIFRRNGNTGEEKIPKGGDYCKGMVEGSFIKGTYLSGNPLLKASFDIISQTDF